MNKMDNKLSILFYFLACSNEKLLLLSDY
jgi:hypothetical protein